MEKGLVCQAWGNPTPTITWYNVTRHRLETEPGKHAISNQVEMENSYNGSLIRGELLFFKINREKHFGWYFCNATNSYGTAIIKILLNGTKRIYGTFHRHRILRAVGLFPLDDFKGDFYSFPIENMVQ
ncbi:hypothetical protein HOLleu_21020 [Holothuria leucospilota]|uniref:Ig-like domain-containing protein n=1 Tax=Holothuria leucospilota TaxID=206669 RepID=A0A9Q1H5Q7_HOLLE|nr:hypothetical protein HOLleu_21020 [Holothuria leucospilota]